MRFTSLLLTILLLATPALADDTESVKNLTRQKINAVIDHLKNGTIDKNARDQKVVKEINPLFDFSQMAKLSMGKKNWVMMNEAQRAEFNDLFVKRLQESYLEKLDLYTDEEVIVDDAVFVKKRIHVRTHLLSDDNNIEMIYKFYKKSDSSWLVYDVEIMGVSIVQTYRSQFAGILKDQSVEELLIKLRQAGSMKIEADNG